MADETAAPHAVATLAADDDLAQGDQPGDELAGDLLADDLLVEEVSIDGMCGVY
jgi:mycofactocin precursor